MIAQKILTLAIVVGLMMIFTYSIAYCDAIDTQEYFFRICYECSQYNYEGALDSLKYYILHSQDYAVKMSCLDSQFKIQYVQGDYNLSLATIDSARELLGNSEYYDSIVYEYWDRKALGENVENLFQYLRKTYNERVAPGSTVLPTMQYIEILQSENHYDEAELCFQIVDKYFEPSASILLLKAKQYVCTGSYIDALCILNQLPGYSDEMTMSMEVYALYLQSIIHFKLNEPEEALTDFETGFRMNPLYEKKHLLGFTFHSLPETELGTLNLLESQIQNQE